MRRFQHVFHDTPDMMQSLSKVLFLQVCQVTQCLGRFSLTLIGVPQLVTRQHSLTPQPADVVFTGSDQHIRNRTPVKKIFIHSIEQLPGIGKD